MYNIKVKDILEATGGILLSGDENVILNDICIDSRKIKEGDLFVPIVGNKIDAHRFIEGALEKGAATLTQHHRGVVISDKPYIQVTNTEKALQDIGVYIRNKMNIPIVGVTGSVGKTTTREMISTALAGCANVYQTSGNFNSQVGVPITLSRAPEDAEVAVIEMGMSEPGEMNNLSRIARPDICVITIIGVAHIENLKTQENIRKEKLSITDYMNKDGALFLNGDDPLLRELAGTTNVKTFYYGLSEECDFRAENIRVENYKIKYDYVHGDVRVPVLLNALGKHNVSNSLVGMAIANYMGYNLADAAKGFESFNGIRQKVISIPGKYTIIDDTYNASPDSMKASIEVLADMDNKGKKIAVLGDMFELGENSEKYHYEIGEFIADKPIDELVVVGDLSQNIRKAVEAADSDIKCYSFKDNGEVALYLMTVMMPDDIVLIKGSNGMNLCDIVSNMRG